MSDRKNKKIKDLIRKGIIQDPKKQPKQNKALGFESTIKGARVGRHWVKPAPEKELILTEYKKAKQSTIVKKKFYKPFDNR